MRVLARSPCFPFNRLTRVAAAAPTGSILRGFAHHPVALALVPPVLPQDEAEQRGMAAVDADDEEHYVV